MSASENVEKLLELAGTKHKYQYILLIISFLTWINCMMIGICLPFLEKVPDIVYKNQETNTIISSQLSYEICDSIPPNEYNITQTYEYSWVIETDIVCDKIKTGLIGSIIYFGNFIASITFNIIAEKIGRKSTFIFSSIFYCILIIVFVFVKNYYLILSLSFLSDIFVIFISFSCLVILEEVTSVHLRGIFGTIVNAGYPCCALAFFPLFSFLKKWQYVFMVNALVCLILLIIFIFIGYESPRFLISQGKVDEGIEIIHNLAKFHNLESKYNKLINTQEYKEIIAALRHHEDDDNQDEVSTDKKTKKEKVNFFSLFKYRSIRYKFLILCFLGFSLNGSYNGISISIKNLPGDLFQNGMLFYVFEVVVGIFSGWLINTKTLGRKGTIILFYFLAFVSFIIFLFYDINDRVKIIVVLICKFSISSVFTIVYPYMLENYPTSIRDLGFGINTACDNFGGMTFPMITELLKEKQLYFVLALINFFEFFLMFFMPETNGKHLPETIAELEKNMENEKEMKNSEKKAELLLL